MSDENTSKKTIEGYEIISEVGKRRFAFWYRVLHSDKECMLAVIHKKYAKNKQFVDSLSNLEALYDRLQHPNVLQVYRWQLLEEPMFVLLEAYESVFVMDTTEKRSIRKKYLKQLMELFEYTHQKNIFRQALHTKYMFFRIF